MLCSGELKTQKVRNKLRYTYVGFGIPSATHTIVADSPGLKYISLSSGCIYILGGRFTDERRKFTINSLPHNAAFWCTKDI